MDFSVFWRNHPSIYKIKNDVNAGDGFDFCSVTVFTVQRIIENMD